VTFKQFIVIPLYIAFMAFTMQAIDQTAAGWLAPVGNVGFGWIAFQAWAMYFMAGGKVEGGNQSLHQLRSRHHRFHSDL
jgi:hypothetical protein